MTRRDYVLIADAIARAYVDLLPDEIGATGTDATTRELQSLYNRVGARAVARRIADALAADNRHFDRARFLRAALDDALETSTHTLNRDVTDAVAEGTITQ